MNQRAALIRKALLTALIVAATALAWAGTADRIARDATAENFRDALAVAALARAFNGVISVAQGTEVAIQPIGVGVTLTLGEILDPINDLVERFSLLALIAAVALGVQLTLSDIAAQPWLSAVMSVFALVLVVGVWRLQPERSSPLVKSVIRAAGIVLFARFLLAAVLLTTHWVDTWFLAERQAAATAQLSTTSASMKRMTENERGLTDGELSFFSRYSEALDIQARLTALQEEVEKSVEEVINLTVVFVLQTLLLPLLGIWVFWWLLKAFWRWTNRIP